MSVLLIGLDEEVCAATITRLTAQEDEVRVLEASRTRAMRWRDMGAIVAEGQATDPDLVERAALGARSVVLGPVASYLAPVLEGIRMAGAPRFIFIARERADIGTVEGAAESYVVLRIPPEGLLRRAKIGADALAECIDAADDLTGTPKMVVEVTTDAGRALLGLPPG